MIAAAEKQLTNLSMCIVQAYESQPLTDAIRRCYQDLAVETVDENQGDKNIIRTSFFNVQKSQAPRGIEQAFQESLPTYQSATMEQHAVEDRAEFHGKPVDYEQVHAIMFVGLDDLKMLSRGCQTGDNNPVIQRVGVSTYSLNDTLRCFDLSTEDLTTETLKEKTDLDLLLVPNFALSDEMQANLPKNVIPFELQGTPQQNAEEVVKKTNAYFLGMN